MRIEEAILFEAKKKPKKKVIYVDNKDDKSAFPDDTVSALEKEIKKAARDLTQKAQGPITLVNSVFQENKVPIPGAYLKARWGQYQSLLRVAVKALGSARGYKSGYLNL